MDTKRFWNKLAGTYDKQALGKYRKAYEETIALSRRYLKPGDLMLDFACGTGITTIALATSVRQVTAIDLSDEMIRLARDKATSAGIENISFKASTLADHDLIQGSFDVITAFNILHGLDRVEAVLSRISALLKAGGLFLSVTDCLGEKTTLTGIGYTLLSKAGIIPRMNSFSRSALQEMIAANGFTVIEEKNLYPSPPNYFIAAQKPVQQG